MVAAILEDWSATIPPLFWVGTHLWQISLFFFKNKLQKNAYEFGWLISVQMQKIYKMAATIYNHCEM